MRFSAMKKIHPPVAHRIDEDVNNDDKDDIAGGTVVRSKLAIQYAERL
jgi:hypothetical protein